MPGAFAQHGGELIAAGYRILPIYPGRKNPSLKAWQEADLQTDDHRRMAANGHAGDGLGILTGQGEVPIHLVDIDTLDERVALAMRAWCSDHLGEGVVRVGRAPKLGLIYRGPGSAKLTSQIYVDEQGREHRFEILGRGQQFVLAGIHPDTGQPYEHADWLGRMLWEIDPTELPEITEDQMLAAKLEFERLCEAEGWTVKGAGTGAARPAVVADEDYIPDPALPLTTAQVVEILEHWDVDDYDKWVQAGMALHHQYGGSDEGFAIWDAWSSRSAKYDGAVMLARWTGFGQTGRRPVTMRTLVKHANTIRPPQAAEPTVRRAVDAQAELEFALDMCDDPVELQGPVAALIARLVAEHPMLRPVAEAGLRTRFKDLVPGGRLRAEDMRRLLRPPAAAGAGGGGAAPAAPGGAWIIDPMDPYRTSREYLDRHHTWTEEDGVRLLRRWQGAWWRWTGKHWREVEAELMRGRAWEALSSAWAIDDQGNAGPFRPNMGAVTNFVDAMGSHCLLSDTTPTPSWLSKHHPAVDAGEILPLANGLLDVGSGHRLQHTPHLWSTYSLPYAYDPIDPLAEPAEWDRFLESIWPGDQESKDTLEEAMGYTLIPDQSLQVFFGLVGATRGGKGVISKVWTELLGAENVIGPQLSTLGTQFGLQNWIGKPLAIIPDGRQGRNDHAGIMLERLLAITGGDAVTVDRKNRDHWTGVLPTRIVLVSNHLPTFSDGSLALVHRLVPLYFRKSFVGGEDRTLVRRLLGELPAILRRCLAARARLKARGYFIVPDSSQELMGEFRDSVSPEHAFVEECCDLGDYETKLEDLYHAWEAWCREHGRAHTSSRAGFTRRLKAAFPGEIEVSRHRKNYYRFRTVVGIRVSDQGGEDAFWS